MDVQMPGMDGPQTLAALRQISPAVLCCFMTGHPGRYSEGELPDRGAAFIGKPFVMADLAGLPRRRLAAA
jgi:CheY-like chemotaxis protein